MMNISCAIIGDKHRGESSIFTVLMAIDHMYQVYATLHSMKCPSNTELHMQEIQ